METVKNLKKGLFFFLLNLYGQKAGWEDNVVTNLNFHV